MRTSFSHCLEQLAGGAPEPLRIRTTHPKPYYTWLRGTDAKPDAAPRARKMEAGKAGRYFSLVGKALILVAWLVAFGYAGKQAYSIRLYAIKTYGRIIHEFDPWFNFRATKYLADNGLKKFFTWFDYESWYPLGRPVGTTIYPGMQMSSVAIWETLKYTMKKPLSLNDVCVFVPAWFGVSASIFLGLLTSECTGSYSAGAAGATIMSIVPAHLMRSVGGGYDNESIALTAMCATFFCWARALRAEPAATDGRATKGSYVFGVLCGLAYIYMVAAWGGFVFVLNMIGAHAALLILIGRYTSKLHRAYTLFYLIGTFGAVHVPVVGWGPLKSLEQVAVYGAAGAGVGVWACGCACVPWGCGYVPQSGGGDVRRACARRRPVPGTHLHRLSD